MFLFCVPNKVCILKNVSFFLDKIIPNWYNRNVPGKIKRKEQKLQSWQKKLKLLKVFGMQI